jgi:hypothetical protein
MGLAIAADDPTADDVRAVLERHLAFAREVTPSEGVHALGVEGLLEPGVTSTAPASTASCSESGPSRSSTGPTPS